MRSLNDYKRTNALSHPSRDECAACCVAPAFAFLHAEAATMTPPEPLFPLCLTGHRAEGGGSEVLMQVTRSLSARIRRWLGGVLGKRPANPPYGAGASGS